MDAPPPPTFDARLFEPPSWSRDPLHAGMNKGKKKDDGDGDGGWDGDDVDPLAPEPVPEDVGVEEDDGVLRFTLDELKNLTSQAETLRAEGNRHFTAKPQRIEDAKRCYLDAVARLPAEGYEASDADAGSTSTSNAGKSSKADSGATITEITDDDDDERTVVKARIRECARAAWGNLGAVYMVTGEHKAAVDACTKALEIDPEYTKVLARRAAANEAVGSWTALSAAQDDYKRLITLLPRNSPQLATAQRALAQLPAKIAAQQEKEKDEMLGKLKELGNGLLGKFGLSTDMFKFDQQPGGGYNVRFEQK